MSQSEHIEMSSDPYNNFKLNSQDEKQLEVLFAGAALTAGMNVSTTEADHGGSSNDKNTAR